MGILHCDKALNQTLDEQRKERREGRKSAAVHVKYILKVCSTTPASSLQLSETSQGCAVLRGQSCLSLMLCKSELRALGNLRALPDGSYLILSFRVRRARIFLPFWKCISCSWPVSPSCINVMHQIYTLHSNEMHFQASRAAWSDEISISAASLIRLANLW